MEEEVRLELRYGSPMKDTVPWIWVHALCALNGLPTYEPDATTLLMAADEVLYVVDVAEGNRYDLRSVRRITWDAYVDQWRRTAREVNTFLASAGAVFRVEVTRATPTGSAAHDLGGTRDDDL
jgi:hypothetical protein